MMRLDVRRIPLQLVALVVGSLVLNLWGNHWGLPREWHPDEVLIRQAVRDMAEHRSLDPKFYLYGPFHHTELLVTAEIPSRVIRKLELVAGGTQDSVWQQRYERRAIVLSRSLSAFYATGVVLLVVALGSLLFNRTTGLIAGWLLASSMGLVFYSHFFTTDASYTFWLATSALLSVLVYTSGERRWYLLAGVAIGLAAAVKYSGIVGVIPLGVAHLLRTERRHRNLLLGLGVVVVVGLLATPPLLVSPFRFIDGFTKEFFFNTGRVWAPQWSGDELLHYQSRPGVVRFLAYVRDSVGWPAFVCGLAAMGYSLFLARKRELRGKVILLWSCVLPYVLIWGTHPVSTLWYALPVLPFLALFSGKLLADLLSSRGRMAAQAGIAAILAYSFAYTIGAVFQLVKDSRYAARDWIVSHLPKGATIETTGGGGDLNFPRDYYQLRNVLMSSDMYGWIELAIENRDRSTLYQLLRDGAFGLERAAQRAGLAGPRQPYVAWYETPGALADYRDVRNRVWSTAELRSRNPDLIVLIEMDSTSMRWSRQAGYYDSLFSGQAGYAVTQRFKFHTPGLLRVDIAQVNPTITLLTRTDTLTGSKSQSR